MKEKYLKLLREIKREGIENLISWLEESDFFEAPASTKYHLNKKGGLVEHSFNVYHTLLDEYSLFTKYETLSDSLTLVGLLHDVCKANYYKLSERNVKNEEGKWIKEPYYTTDDQFPIGHGEKSVIIIQRFVKLTDEEIAAIRWHMGGYESKENYQYISNAFAKYPLVTLLHIADLKATYLYEKEN